MIRNPKRIRHLKGFTLVEILVALTVFSIISLASYRLLSSTALFVQSNDAQQAFLLEQERAFAVIQNDLRHVILKSLKQESGAINAVFGAGATSRKTAMRGDSEVFHLEFMRGGYAFTFGKSAGTNAQIRYELRPQQQVAPRADLSSPRPNELVRVVIPHQHTSARSSFSDGNSREQVLLKNVGETSVRFLDSRNQWVDNWPVTEPQALANVPIDQSQLPLALGGDIDHTLPMAVELMINVNGQSLRKLIALRS